MNGKDQRRAETMRRLCDGSITKSQAEELLSLGRRQVDRLLADYRLNGVGSVVHGNRGRVPANRLDSKLVGYALSVCDKGGKYDGFNVCHISDLLAENDSINIARSTLDRLLRANGIIKSGAKGSKARRKRRERARREGEMLQIDGSPHDWLEGRGPRMCLVGAVDDATGKLLYGQFRPTEDLDGYLMMLRRIAKTRGLPESLYHDRHTILISPKPATIQDELAGAVPMSQFQRLVDQLGIVSIPAGSPQAKGRVERLWGVLQDRLVKEMRLAEIGNIEEANAFLPGYIRRYNSRFAIEPADPEPAWVKIEQRMDLAYYFCKRESRAVRSDHTISWMGRTLQILPRPTDKSLAGETVNVHVTPEQEILIYNGKQRLNYTVVPTPAKQHCTTRNSPAKATRAKRSAAQRRWLFAKTAA